MNKSFLLTAIIAALWSPTAAHAASRAFVSGKGTDSTSCGPAGSPCRTPQYAHDNIVSAGGEIDILDPAGYGAITITKSISIINDGVGIAGFLAQGAGAAITINAGANDTIVFRGLTIEGSSDGASGIAYNAAGQLIVSNCTFRFTPNFQGGGSAIGIRPSVDGGTNRIEVSNTFISTKDDYGILYLQSRPDVNVNATLILDHVTVIGSRSGGIVVKSNGSGSVNSSISNTVSSFSETGYGFQAAGGGPMTASIEGSYATNNNSNGVVVQGATVYLGNTDIALNGVGVSSGAYNNNAAKVYTYGDNQIDGNFDSNSTPTNIVGGALLPTPQR